MPVTNPEILAKKFALVRSTRKKHSWDNSSNYCAERWYTLSTSLKVYLDRLTHVHVFRLKRFCVWVSNKARSEEQTIELSEETSTEMETSNAQRFSKQKSAIFLR